ncbi:MAG: hypothetical protein HY261_11485, partial [Chloroflexi bacterium]|nr:hypothetical protein [Chloroflexota bacterium]
LSQQVLDVLSVTLSAAKSPSESPVPEPVALDAPDDPLAFYEFALAKGWSDGHPVLAPMPAIVERMIGASGLHADDVVAQLPPRWGDATVRRIAANAAMAGCRPDYMPLLVAAVRAIAHPDFNLHGIQCTTNPVAPLLIVNGPIRKELGIEGGRGCFGPGFRANATIGRAMRLMLLNIGGGITGETDKAINGFPGKFGMCFGELEEESPWTPLHIDRGFKASDSTVTVVGIQDATNILPMLRQAESVLTWTANALGLMGANNVALGQGEPVVMLPPGHAKMLADQGYDKAKIQQALFEKARIPLKDFPKEGNIPVGKWHIEGDYVCPTERWQDILVVVAGGPEPYHVQVLHNFGETRAITERVG